MRKVEKGGLTSSSWYLKGTIEKTISCQPTPGGILARTLKQHLNKGPVNRILVTEDGGTPILSGLRKAEPFHPQQCRYKDPNCIVESGKDCAKTGVIYEITCTVCSDLIDQNTVTREPGGQPAPNYIGMSRTSAHWRMNYHLQGQKGRLESNPLFKHDTECHNGQPQLYKTRILKSEKNLLPLCIQEALFIEKQIEGTSLNSKNEYGRGGLVHLTARRDI